MKVRLFTTVDDGVDAAHLEITGFSNDEKVQASKFGALILDLGGIFAEAAIPEQAGPPVVPAVPAVNYSLEPIRISLDPAVTNTVMYDRIFKKSAEFPIPGLAAAAFCRINLAKIHAAVTSWKALTDQYTVDLFDNV
jgi:hypothetical protein